MDEQLRTTGLRRWPKSTEGRSLVSGMGCRGHASPAELGGCCAAAANGCCRCGEVSAGVPSWPGCPPASRSTELLRLVFWLPA